MHGHHFKAEKLFQEALEEDVSFGPAHNNLGLLYLSRHQLYLAAWEFEYAANLMPDLVEPIVNQGLAYETAEQIDRAIEFYRRAHMQNPHHTIALASLTRALVKQDGDPGEIGYLLDELIMHDTRQEWVTWAKELRATRYRDQCIECDDEQVQAYLSSGDVDGASIAPIPERNANQVFEFIEEIPPPMESLPGPINDPETPSTPDIDPPSTTSPLRELLRLSPADVSTKPVRLPLPAGTREKPRQWPLPITEKVQQASHENSNSTSSIELP